MCNLRSTATTARFRRPNRRYCHNPPNAGIARTLSECPTIRNWNVVTYCEALTNSERLFIVCYRCTVPDTLRLFALSFLKCQVFFGGDLSVYYLTCGPRLTAKCNSECAVLSAIARNGLRVEWRQDHCTNAPNSFTRLQPTLYNHRNWQRCYINTLKDLLELR
jgi:hypothetical protein